MSREDWLALRTDLRAIKRQVNDEVTPLWLRMALLVALERCINQGDALAVGAAPRAKPFTRKEKPRGTRLTRASRAAVDSSPRRGPERGFRAIDSIA